MNASWTPAQTGRAGFPPRPAAFVPSPRPALLDPARRPAGPPPGWHWSGVPQQHHPESHQWSRPPAFGPGHYPPVRRGRASLKMLLVTMSLAGMFLLGQVVWETWGSDLYAAHRQRALAAAFEAAAADPAAALTDGSASPSEVAGQMARLRIPDLGIDTIVVSGVSRRDLRTGAGWDRRTSFPGDPGNATIAGHRTTYGSPFRELDKLERGSRIIVEVPGRPPAVFEVRASMIVEPHDVWVTSQTDGVRLTLTTCHPLGDDTERLIIQAELIEGAYLSDALPVERWRPSTSV
jgi:LPXTG-site transpeptidase (sortase) family protein